MGPRPVKPGWRRYIVALEMATTKGPLESQSSSGHVRNHIMLVIDIVFGMLPVTWLHDMRIVIVLPQTAFSFICCNGRQQEPVDATKHV